MSDLVVIEPRIVAMEPSAISKVRLLETAARAQPQVSVQTDHVIHAGMYARTVFLAAGTMITGALVKRATLLIVAGEASIYVGTDEPLHVSGYAVLRAAAGRKQAIIAITHTYLTMLFPTEVRTVEDAEREFTDEPDILMSRLDPSSNHIRITEEEHPCPH